MWLFGVLVYVTVTSQDVIADPNSDWSDEEMLSNQEESIQLWTSDNVVAENLKAARGLDTTYYVTSSDQSSDFFWDRESGLRVNIGVNKVDLSATFYGVKPESDDNDFVLEAPKSPVTEAEKERFRNEVTTFCRHPVPDYHKVTMEMFKDRTTRAEYISCDSSGSEEDSRCRGEFTFPNLTSSSSSATSFQRTGRGMNNDRRIIAQHEKEKHHNLVYRHLNEPCVKMGTFPRQIEKATNGIACHRRADKLSPMFGLVRDDLDHHITFAPKHCKEASVTCDLCLADAKKRCHDNTTRGNGDSTSNCCYLDCWNSPPCIHSKSSRCTEGKVECSSGQVNLYTLEPVFSKERTDCHVISASDDDQLPVAYELFFFLQFQSPSSSTWHSGIFPDSNDQSLNVGEKMGRRLIKRTYVHPLNPPNGDFDHKNGDHHRNNNSSSSKQPSLFYQSKTFHKKILPRDIQTWASSKSRVAFLTVQHETGLKLSKEMIITKIEQDGSWKHFIEALDGPDDDVKKKNIESKDSSPEIKRRAPHKVVDKRAQDDEDDDERDNDSREDYELSTNLSADEEMIKRGHSTSYDDEAGYDDYNVGGDGNDITEKKIHSHVLTIDAASRKQDGLHRRQHGPSKLPDVTPSRKTGSHKQPPQQQQQQQQQNKNNYFHVQQVLPNSYTLLAKLIRPFIYSSANWGKGNRCSNKEPKWFKPYRPATRRLQEVNLDVDVNDDRFKYSVRSSNGAPYIRFTIPANQSILGDFFPPSSNFRIIRDGRKLKMKVVQGHDLKWRIHIFGETSGCPCYIKLEMFEGSKTSPLLLYDLLVLCPSKFTVIMTLPGGVVPFLSIKLIDSITTHSFFVTFDQKHQFPNSNRSDAPTSSASLATDATGALTKPTATASSLSMFCILSIVASCLLMLRVILTPLWFGILHGEVCYLTDETTAFRCHNLSGQSINSSSFPLLEFQTSSTCSVLPKYKQSKSSKDSPASPITSSLSSGSSSSPKLLAQNVNRPSKPRSDPSHFHRRCCCSQHETTTTTTATTTTTTTTSTTFQKLIDKKESFEMSRSKMKDIVNLYFVVLVIYSLLTTFSASFFIFQTLAATRVSHGNPSGSKVDTRNDSSQVIPDDAWRDSSRMESLLSDCNSKFLDFIRILLTRSESHFANPAKGRNFGTSGFFRSGKIGSINQPTSAVVENSACRILPTLCLVCGKVEGLKNELMEEALDTLRNISKRGTNSTIRENRWLDIFKHLSDNAVDFDTEVDDDGGKQVVEKGLLGILKFPDFKDGYDVLRLGMIKNSSLFRLFIPKQPAGEEFHDFMENFGKRISSKMASSESHHLLTSFEDSQGCRSQCGRCGGCGCCGRVRCGDVDPGGASYCPSLSSIRFFVGSSEESTAFGSQISSIDDDGDEDGRIGNDARIKLIQNHYDDDSIWKGMMPSQSSPPLSSSSSSSLTSSSSQEFSDLKNVLRLAFFVLDLFLTLYRVTESYKKCLGLFSCPSMRCCSLGGPTMNCRREATSTTQMLPSSADVNCQADQRHVDGDVTKRDDDDDDDDGDDVGGSGNNDVTRTNNSSRVERKRPPEVNTPKTLKAEKSPYFSSCFSGVSSLNRSAPLEHPVAKGRGQATPGSVRRKRRLKYFFFRFRFFALVLCSMYRTSFPRSLVAFLVLSFTSLIVFVIDSSSCPSDVMRIMNVLYTNDTLVYKTRRDHLEIQPEVQDISRLQSYLFDKTLFRELNSMVDLFRAGHNRSNTEEDKNKNEENLADDDDDDGDDDDDEDGDDEDDDDDEKDLLAPLLSCAGETYTSEKAYEYDEEENGSTVLSEGTSEDEGSREEILFAMLATSRAIVVFIITTFLVHLLCMATEVGIKMALFWRYESYHWRLIQHFSSQPSFSTVGTCSENTANMFSPGCSCFLCHEMTTHNIGCHVKKIDIDRCIAKLSHHHHQHHPPHHHHYHIFTDSCYLSLPNERHLKPRDQTIPSFASTAADDIAHRTQLYCPPMNRGSVVSYLETKV